MNLNDALVCEDTGKLICDLVRIRSELPRERQRLVDAVQVRFSIHGWISYRSRDAIIDLWEEYVHAN